MDEKTRLQKYIAQTGLCSRRKAEEYIKQGYITVNDKKIDKPYYMVEDSDIVKYKGRVLKKEVSFEYYLLNKPLEYICTNRDRFADKKAVDLIKTDVRLVTAGRLDKNTTGALILSNDGKFINHITHPKHELEKEYIITLSKNATNEDLEKLKKGVKLDNGYITKKAKARFGRNKKEIYITISEGKNRQVRRMMKALDLNLVKLHRRSIGRLNVDNIKEGRYRQLSLDDIRFIYNS